MQISGKYVCSFGLGLAMFLSQRSFGQTDDLKISVVLGEDRVPEHLPVAFEVVVRNESPLSFQRSLDLAGSYRLRSEPKQSSRYFQFPECSTPGHPKFGWHNSEHGSRGYRILHSSSAGNGLQRQADTKSNKKR